RNQDLNPGEGASPESFFPSFRPAVAQLTNRGNGKVSFMKTKTSLMGNSMNRSPVRAQFLHIPLVLASSWFALAAQAQAVCQQGCDLSNGNTFLGDDALISNETGYDNTANGAFALESNSIGYVNTATGVIALFNNTTGFSNTATGVG